MHHSLRQMVTYFHIRFIHLIWPNHLWWQRFWSSHSMNTVSIRGVAINRVPQVKLSMQEVHRDLSRKYKLTTFNFFRGSQPAGIECAPKYPHKKHRQTNYGMTVCAPIDQIHLLLFWQLSSCNLSSIGWGRNTMLEFDQIECCPSITLIGLWSI